MDARVADLLGRMTTEEKFWQLFMIPGDLDNAAPGQYSHGIFGLQVSAGAGGKDAAGQLLQYNTSETATQLAKKINSIQKYFVEQTRLGIPIIAFDEALHGLVRNGATAFPQSIALAATWDTALVHRVAAQIALECRMRGIRQILSPVVNIATDVRWGRTEETYGEDPFLVSEMGVAFVSAFEKKGIITTPKHFIANVGDGGRDSYPIHLSERILDELHFPPFKACILRGGARSVMTAYNSVDGVAASSSRWLLTDQLKNKWGFKGFVISDANAVGGELVLHNTAKDYAESGQHAINGGLDVIFQTEYKHHTLFYPAFEKNEIDSARLNDAVARVLKAKFELGLFEQPYISEAPVMDDSKAKAIARQAAAESFVLLKNEKNILPLNSSHKTIAVIGADAAKARLGGYSGPGNGVVSILEGIQKRAGRQHMVLYAEGSRKEETFEIVPANALSNDGRDGLWADYYSNAGFNGTPALTRTDHQIDFHWTLFGPDAVLSNDFYAVRWHGQYKAETTGYNRIGLEGNDGFRMYINDRLLIDQWQKQSYSRVTTNYYFEKGKAYNIRIEFYETNGNATIRLVQENKKAIMAAAIKMKEAVAAAKKADVVIVAAGINEGEFEDRALLSLPGNQEALLQELTATGKPVIVLLSGGSAITMDRWKDKVKAIAAIWYPGEEGGNAIAGILFGDDNPAGRLPITYPVHEGQLPLVYNHKPTGRGDDYINLSGQPLFPFGYGLSYTSFEYSGFVFDKATIRSNENTVVRFRIKNTGNKDGDEVPQLYIRDVLSSVARPVMELKGFQRIHLKAGETKQLSFVITPEMLSMLDKDLQLVIEPGEFRIMIGASSKDIRWKGNLIVQ
ncbi:MAG: glycoside hydrolase family 3 N-terminal domain-containing protein [Ferruginibacter sp.]